ncbi:hypothetical protein UFOVP760_260 [uncultured Caudovirales phage]|uniref:Uncharacterized protein n=1 Tax=uncultured Caudovirales phage TaxID=2100421 RepID=A0A6J7XA25_9CAUD|nr:hypothetical protein UFOVP760_260 [uncultured Caudovirales phage]
MKIKNIEDQKVTLRHYTIEYTGPNFKHGTYIYVDYYDEKGKVIDSRLQTEEGYAVEDWSFFEEVQEFIDTEGDVKGLQA